MKLWALLAAFAAIGAGIWAAEQQPVVQQPVVQADEPTRIQVDVTRVSLLYTVTDRRGRFVTNLTKDDFEVIDSKKPQRILEFNAESDLPLPLGILIQNHNSTIHANQDRAMLVSFDTKAELVSDLIADTEKLATAIRQLRPGGGTSLYDAIFFACRDKLSQDQPKHKFRRAIVIVTDGDDNQSQYTRDQALEMAQKADVVIYAISTNISKIESDGDKVLKYLTGETGGKAFFPFKVEDLEQSFENIANELRHQYNIAYRPDPLKTDGLFHLVDLRVKNRKDLVVHVRKGYYALKM